MKGDKNHIYLPHVTILQKACLNGRVVITFLFSIFVYNEKQFFGLSIPGAMKLQNLILKLKKWIKILETKTKTLPNSFLIEEKCRFLSNFSRSTAEVELPGEFLLPKYSTHYYVCIQRFMPKVRKIMFLYYEEHLCKDLIVPLSVFTNEDNRRPLLYARSLYSIYSFLKFLYKPTGLNIFSSG